MAYTQLSISATPGRRYSFPEPSIFVAHLPDEYRGSASTGYVFRYDREEEEVIPIDRFAQAKREDEEILMVIKAFLDII